MQALALLAALTGSARGAALEGLERGMPFLGGWTRNEGGAVLAR